MFEKKYLKYYKNYNYDKNNKISHLYDYDSPHLKILIAIDESNFKSSLGGCRFINNTPRHEAIKDVCCLAKAMTKKNILAEIKYGGGKSFIYYSDLDRYKMLKIFSDLLNYLGGIYQTADDINTTVEDMEYMRNYTKFARGYRIGNYQIPATSYGVFLAIKATVKETLNKSSLKGIKIGIQGIGKVGYNLAKLLYKEKCIIYISEINKDKINKLREEVEFTLVDDVITDDIDIICPCALGGVINFNNLKNIKAKFIIGGANNQLKDEKLDILLHKNKITYIPDILANCGGVIDLDCEGDKYCQNYVYKRVNLIYDKTSLFVKKSLQNNKSVLEIVNSYIDCEMSKDENVCINHVF